MPLFTYGGWSCNVNSGLGLVILVLVLVLKIWSLHNSSIRASFVVFMNVSIDITRQKWWSIDCIVYWENMRMDWLRSSDAASYRLCLLGWVWISIFNKLCAWGRDMPHPSPPVGEPAPRVPPSRPNVAVVSNAQYVLTITAAPASRIKTAMGKGAWLTWLLTFWPWKWYPSHVRRVLPLCACYGLPRSVNYLGPMYETGRRQTDKQMSDVRQKHSLMPLTIRGGGIFL